MKSMPTTDAIALLLRAFCLLILILIRSTIRRNEKVVRPHVSYQCNVVSCVVLRNALQADCHIVEPSWSNLGRTVACPALVKLANRRLVIGGLVVYGASLHRDRLVSIIADVNICGLTLNV